MRFCKNCGHELDVGRFCTNCGAPIEPPLAAAAASDDRHDATAGKPAVPPAGPPPVGPPPVGPPPAGPPPVGPPPPAPPIIAPPLFAPPPVGPPPVGPPPVGPPPAPPAVAPPLFAPPPAGPARSRPTRRARRPWLPWVVGAAVLILVATTGGVLLLTGDDGEPQAKDPGSTASTSVTTSPSTNPSPSATATFSPPPPTSFSSSWLPSLSTMTPSTEPEDVAHFATAIVPATAPPNQDLAGNQVRYEARNMLDGVPETCWRMPGDGTGSTITFRLAEQTTLTRVGLINGYAKTAVGADGSRLDWYTGNRRIGSVAWTFDDGTVLIQDLAETRAMQTIDVDSVSTSTIRLQLLEVSQPGTGRASRDYTPISDVTLVGTPG